MLIGLIVACEIGFWVFLGAGLVARYGLRWPRTSAALLLCVPLVDVVLLAATVADLRGGGVASTAHGLAAVYLGFSVVFGHRTVTRIDAWVAHRYAGGPAPVRAPRTGRPRVAHEWVLWQRAAVAWLVSCSLLGAAILAIGDGTRTDALTGWLFRLTLVLLIWLLVGPGWVWAREALRTSDRTPGTKEAGAAEASETAGDRPSVRASR